MKPFLKHAASAFTFLRKREILVLAGSVVVLAATAVAATVTPNALGAPTWSRSSRKTTFTWLVVPQGNESIKDFHIRTVGTKKPPTITPLPANGWPGCQPSGTGADWFAGSSGGAITTATNPNGVVFQVEVSDQKGEFTDLSKSTLTVVVSVTSSGGQPSNVGTVVTTGSGGNLPVAYIEPEDKPIPWGCGTAVALTSTECGQSYRVYALSSVTNCPDPWLDLAAFQDFATNHPVPGIEFAGMTGTLNGEGEGSIVVNVPEMEPLHGQHFFLVASVEEVVEGETSNVYSWPAHEYVVE